jgi:hypothetical protein
MTTARLSEMLTSVPHTLRVYEGKKILGRVKE